MVSPSATVLCTASSSSRFPPPHTMVVLFLTALLAAGLRPTSSSPSGTSLEPILTFCSGHQSPNFTSSSPAFESGEFASFIDAVCAGAYGVAHMSHNMSSYAAGTNRTMFGVAQCRPGISVPDCAACLAAASSHLISRKTACAAAAAWHDACFLRYYSDDRDPGRFDDDEYTATVFNATRTPLPLPHQAGGRAAVRRLLAAAGNITTSSHMCRGVGARTAAGGRIYGLTQCAPGLSCDDCRRCLRGAVAAAEREYNGSAGMQVLRLSCMARYESYPFYNTASLQSSSPPFQIPDVSIMSASSPAAAQHVCVSRCGIHGEIVTGGGLLNASASPPAAAAPPAPAPPAGGHTRTPPAEAPPAGGTGGPPPVPPAAGDPFVHHADPPPPAAATPPDQTRVMQQSHEKTPKMLIMLIVTIASGLLVAGVTLVLIIWYRRKQPPAQKGHVVIDGMRQENMYDRGEEQWSKEEEDEDGEIMSCQLYSYQVLEAATHHFSNSNKLGSGGFGTVFKGTLENGKEVAVKRLRDSKRNIHNLEREISIVSDLRHKNLVKFLGYCFQDEGRFLVYEYVPNNSLEKFWYKACFQSQKLEWATWFDIIKGVARGLRFLHDKGIIHRDLKPHNVLLDENFNPKIADFDLMRMYDKQKTHESTEKVAGTFGYMAPECTSGRKFLLSIKSDVYSYGVLVLEIITGHKIYTFEGQNSEGLVEYVWQHWTEKRVADIVDGELGVHGKEHAARQALRCVHIALLCVQSDRSRRPTMGQVIAMLSSDDGTEALQEPSLPGYVVFRPTAAASGPVRLLCLGCR